MEFIKKVFLTDAANGPAQLALIEVAGEVLLGASSSSSSRAGGGGAGSGASRIIADEANVLNLVELSLHVLSVSAVSASPAGPAEAPAGGDWVPRLSALTAQLLGTLSEPSALRRAEKLLGVWLQASF